MKKILLLSVLCLAVASGALFSGVASADKSGGGFNASGAPAGGFTGPGPAIVGAKAAADLKDSTRVALKGHIVQHLGDDQYLFKDTTGTIQLDIDDHIWRGVVVAPADTVIVYGKIDRDFNSLEVDVKKIEKQ